VTPSLSIAIARLSQADSNHFAIWVMSSPMPGGYVHQDCTWPDELTQLWAAWQEFYSLQEIAVLPFAQSDTVTPLLNFPREGESYSGQLMQQLGISLWNWLFSGAIGQSLAQSWGLALGQNRSLRIRLEIRDPYLISLPWEIMKPDTGRQSISLHPQILFSRTTTKVEPLVFQASRRALKILLVLGEQDSSDLTSEATVLSQILTQVSESALSDVAVKLDTLIQPTPAVLTEALDNGDYNIFFYAGHGMTAPNGGYLLLRHDAAINGTELAQALVRNQVTLAVCNACWGAQPAYQEQQVLEQSSLAEVLLHHGVPAVLGMRDSISDEEALCFIKAFTKVLTQRLPIDQAVRFARQQLLTIYRYNQPAWTLPILYLHPEFDGQLLEPNNAGITELPDLPSDAEQILVPAACLRSKNQGHVWQIYGGLMRVGRDSENDLVIEEKWVSHRHGEIFCRGSQYFLTDHSRFGTFISTNGEWQMIHRQEIRLESGVQLRFGSLYGQVLEFSIES
jgi:CHAT domain/FHA domain